MDIHGVVAYTSESAVKEKDSKSKINKTEMNTNNKSASIDEKKETKAVVVETKSKEQTVGYSKQSSKVDQATIEQLKKEAEERTAQLRAIVEKLLMKQSQTYNNSLDVYDVIRSGKLEVDEETRLHAQEDIAEDGYWGVEQTSERLFSFAKALAGSGKSKADAMVEAFKQGYAEAEKKWGGELPEICGKTYDAFLKKMDDWKNSEDEA